MIYFSIYITHNLSRWREILITTTNDLIKEKKFKNIPLNIIKKL